MRILVLSDSHGDTATLSLALRKNSDADAVIFLGDGIADFQSLMPLIGDKPFAAVRGNCDFYAKESGCPAVTLEIMAGKTVYCTHGFLENVKYGTQELKNAAREKGAHIALFGHTHTPLSQYDDGLYLLNPGSVRQNSCGIVDITDKGIMCFTKNIIGPPFGR